jgi:hypothetical protein
VELPLSELKLLEFNAAVDIGKKIDVKVETEYELSGTEEGKSPEDEFGVFPLPLIDPVGFAVDDDKYPVDPPRLVIPDTLLTGYGGVELEVMLTWLVDGSR